MNYFEDPKHLDDCEPPKQADDEPVQYNDDMIYNRLPQNFFLQDQEYKDLDVVIANIKNMRQDFMQSMNDNHFQEKLDEISNIISPEKFVKKHFGVDDPAEAMFNQVISEETQRVSSRKSLREEESKLNTIEQIQRKLD